MPCSTREPAHAAARRLLDKVEREARAEAGFQREVTPHFVVKWRRRRRGPAARRALLTGWPTPASAWSGSSARPPRARDGRPLRGRRVPGRRSRPRAGSPASSTARSDCRPAAPLPPRRELERILAHEYTHAVDPRPHAGPRAALAPRGAGAGARGRARRSPAEGAGAADAHRPRGAARRSRSRPGARRLRHRALGRPAICSTAAACRRCASSWPGSAAARRSPRRCPRVYGLPLARARAPVAPRAGRLTPAVFHKILIANRGEIALRIIRTCRELGIRTVIAHSTADAHSLPVRVADESICVGPDDARGSYLNIAAIISAAVVTDSEAIHPGYGFLAENPAFADICRACGLTFIGPSPEAIRLMGDKAQARVIAKQAGVPVVPGSEAPLKDEAEAIEVADAAGYPGDLQGGGRRRRPRHAHRRAAGPRSGQAFAACQAEAGAAFGSSEIYCEKYIEEARHVEVQVLGDKNGMRVHLGERDCSVQRRHQKLIEESPAPVAARRRRARPAQGRPGRGRRRELRQRRHRRVPGRRPHGRLLLHRDEHAHPGRAPGHRDDHRHRSGPRADPHRRPASRSATARTPCGSTATRSSAGSTPRTR